MLDTELLLWSLGSLMVALFQFFKEGLRWSWFLFLGSSIFWAFYIRRMIKKYFFPEEEDEDDESLYW